MNRKNAPPVGIGVVTVFTVLLVLTLSVFSALTLTSARADLALSRTNARTVSAYYAADAEAAALYEEFAAGTEVELVADVPMTERQSLHIHLVREGDGVKILAWQTVPLEDGADLGGDSLPVWDGTLPG
ncbi:hypothetical protein [Pseudoflavonifractor phocaeensis]|uniref:hypothetical protein n=1 Tax=Pseudoflavonifractor phocaeensis TaxID=1870988 RepID=UPI00210AB98B|nr:hypothetical protein [Pseudoflavonifractor phocaeensis]MCQ4864327.1 hypothetical protein [Pseudoflavonifractor phocaeensis]